MKTNLLLALMSIAVGSVACTTTSSLKDSFALPSPKITAYANDRHLCENDNYATLRSKNSDLWIVDLDGDRLHIETKSIWGWGKSAGPLRLAQYELRVPPGPHTLTVDLSSYYVSSKFLQRVDITAEKGHVYFLYANEVNSLSTGAHTWRPEFKDNAVTGN